MINTYNKSNALASTLDGELMSNTVDSPSPCKFICHMCGRSSTSITENRSRPSDCTMVSEYCTTAPFHEFPNLYSLQSYLASRENMNGEPGATNFSHVEESLPFYFAVLCKVCYNVTEKNRVTKNYQKDCYSVEDGSRETKNSTVELLEPATEVTQEQQKVKPNKRRRSTRLHKIEVDKSKNDQLESSAILTRNRAITETSKKLNSFPTGRRRSLRLNKIPRINYSETVTKLHSHQNNFKPSDESLIVTDFLEIDLTEDSREANNSTTDGEQKSDSFSNYIPINAEDALNINQTKNSIDTAISANDNSTMDTSMQEDSNRELEMFEFVCVDETRQNPDEFYPSFVQEKEDPLRSKTADVPFQGDILSIVEPACSSNGISSTSDTYPLAIMVSHGPDNRFDDPSPTQCIKDTLSKNQNCKRPLEGTWDLIHSDDGDDDGPDIQKMQDLSRCDLSLNEPRNIEQLLGCSESSTDVQNVNGYSSRKSFLIKMLTKIDETLERSFQPLSFNGSNSVKSSVAIQNIDVQPCKSAEYSHPLESSYQAGIPTSINDESTAQRESSEQIREDSETANECESSHPLPASIPNSVLTEFRREIDELLSESAPIVGQCSKTSTSLKSNSFDNSEWVSDACDLECPDDVISLSPPSLSPVSDKSRHEFVRRGSPHPFVDFVNSSSRRSAMALSNELDELDAVFFSDDSQL